EGLSPSPPADRVTLLRRLSLDLIGLPPSPEEVDAFLADRSRNAYGKQVERLLASPHYGERWGRLWLDAARYADSDGFEKDKQRKVWFYRDWVINALNRDMPYNQFIIDQIAGDLLPHPTQEQMKRAESFRKTREIEAGLEHRAPDWEQRMARWEEQAKQGQPEWTVVRPTVEDISNGGQKYLPMKDGSFLAQGYAPAKHRVKMTVRTALEGVTAFRLELLNDPTL